MKSDLYCYNIQEIYKKLLMDIYMHEYVSLITTIPWRCVKVLFERDLMKHCPDKYKNCEICKKALNYSFPSVVRYFPYWFVTPKMLKEPENINLDNVNLDKFIILCNVYE